MRATRDFASAVPVMTYGAGRTCAHRGCRTQLSRYNHSSYCALHEPADDELPEGFKQCRRCERVLPLDSFRETRKLCADGVERGWRYHVCLACHATKDRQRSRDRARTTNYARDRERARNNYYQRTYGYPTREAYRAACARGEA